jgi:hypothetical protein
MTLNAYQMSYNGLTFGDGTDYDIVAVEGLEGLDGIRSGDIVKARDHGEWMGSDFLSGRDITLTLEVTATSDSAFRSDIETLMAATVLQTSELPLAFYLPGMAQTSRQSLVRPRKRPVPLTIDYLHRIAQFVMQFHATDFRIYDSTVQSTNTTLPVPSGGVSWPASWPWSWGSASGSGLVTCTNAGNFETRPTITIVGPVDYPTVQNLTTGLSATFNLTLGVSDSLVIDMLNKTVVLNGTANRRSAMSAGSSWWTLPPGSSQIAYHANTLSTGSTMTVAFQSAWT